MRDSIFTDEAIVLLLLIPSFAASLFSIDMPYLGALKDDGVYVATAWSIAKTGTYRTASLPGSPKHIKYPPLYPAFISVAFHFGSTPNHWLSAAHLLHWFSLPLFALLCLKFFQREHCPLPWLWTLVCVSFAGVWISAHSFLTDLWMGAAGMAVFLLFEKHPARSAVVATAAYLLRTSAVSLIMAVLVCYLLQRRVRHAAVFFIIVAPFAVARGAWSAMGSGPIRDYNYCFMSTYVQQFVCNTSTDIILQRTASQALLILESIGNILVPEFYDFYALSIVKRLVGFLILLCIAFLPRLHQLYVLFSLMLLLLWPWRPFSRFFVPVLPVLVAGVVRIVTIRLRLSIPWWANLSVFAWFLISLLSLEVGHGFMAQSYRQQNRAITPAFEWIRTHTPGNATFCASRDAFLWLFTGRQAESIHVSLVSTWKDPKASEKRIFQMAEWARSRGHQYILLTPWDYGLSEAQHKKLRQFLRGKARLVFESDHVSVFDLGVR